MIDINCNDIATNLTFEFVRVAINKAFGFILTKYNIGIKTEAIDKYIEHCEKLLTVKTLLSTNRDYLLNQIYVPLTIKTETDVSLDVADGVNLDHESRTVIIKGIAGMGKSTVLRKLLVNCLNECRYFPIFYEIKNYKGGNIEHNIMVHMKKFGLDLCENQIETFLDDSNTKLFMDAFDECHPKYRSELISEIEKLIYRYNCKIYLTSRPDTEIDNVPHLITYQIKDLSKAQTKSIIYKSTSSAESAEHLWHTIEKNRFATNPGSILKSPILVVLLCLTYNAGAEIPETLPDFYKNIFDTMFFRHDNLKVGISRKITWEENKKIYQETFEALSFITQQDEASQFDRRTLTSYFTESLKYMDEDSCKADAMLDDIVNVTNLIIQDGYNSYKFIHKSIQEYYTASFVLHLDAPAKVKFYEKCKLDKDLDTIFSNSLQFLEYIDYENYIKEYYMPLVEEILSLNNKKIDSTFTPSEKLMDSFIKSIRFSSVYNILKTKGKTQNVIESRCGFYIEAENNEKIKLFRCAISLLDILTRTKDHDLAKIVSEFGVHKGGIYTCDYSTIKEFIDIQDMEFVNALSEAACLTFKEKYNSCLKNIVYLKNRNKVGSFSILK